MITDIICGAGGFLGSNLKRHLVERKRTVEVLPVDMLLSTAKMHDFLKAREPYRLFFLAAYGNLHGQADISMIYHVSVTKLFNILSATLDTDCKAFLTAGSTSEYGDKKEPMTENQVLCPVTFYAAAKAAATHLAQVWAKQYKTPIVIFRPASITGVGEQSIHLIPTLIRSCIFREEMPFEGGYYHDYINVTDVCSALEILSGAAESYKGEIFNVGSGEQTSNLEIKEMIESITREKANISKAVKINPQNVSAVWIADSSKLQALGWKPKISLYRNLQDMVRAV